MSFFSDSITICISNGDRLVEDCKILLENGSYASAKALSILAQEEFAKAYILKLVNEGAISWTSSVFKATKDHICKQLVGIIMEYLFVPYDDIQKYSIKRSEIELPKVVVDSLNMICHNKIMDNYIEDDEYKYGKDAKKILEGKIEKSKQNAIYVSLNKNGSVKSIPNTSQTDVMKELQYSELLKDVASGHDVFAYDKLQYIIEVLKIVFDPNHLTSENETIIDSMDYNTL